MLSSALQHLGIAIGFAQTAAPIAGVPLAMGLAAEIVKSCDEVVKQHVCVGIPFFFFFLP